MNYQRLPFAEVKHLLLPDAWTAWRNEEQAGEFEEESVLLFDRSVTLDSLNLDLPFGETEHVFLIVVKGNLTVESYIYNEDTDGAAGLIVLGDLQARNMLVGGQEIYVTGNLTVEEVFWGDYNHGDLHVLGGVTATVFAETDEYSVSVGKKSNFGVHLEPFGAGSQWIGLDKGLVRAHLIDEFAVVDEDGAISLVRDASILSHLQAGQSLLKKRS